MEIEDLKDIPELPDDEEEGGAKGPRPQLEDIRSLHKYTVPTYPIFVGRERKCSICIAVPAVSRKHAKVFERDGNFYIQDLGSINGTFLNEKRILDPAEMKDGDRIKISVTQKYPKGVREFVFRRNLPTQQKEESERDLLLKEIGVTPGEVKKILLRHCLFKISKRDIVSVFKAEEFRRVPLVRLDFAKRMVSFQSIVPFKVKDTINCSLEHPRLTESVKFTIRILSAQAVPPEDYAITEYKGMIVKFSEQHKALYDKMIQVSDLICYITSTVKSETSQEESYVDLALL